MPKVEDMTEIEIDRLARKYNRQDAFGANILSKINWNKLERKEFIGEDGSVIKTTNIIGLKFGRLTTIKYLHKKKTVSFWLFKCDCGNTKIAARQYVINGNIQSCGCLFKETVTKHGHSKNPKEKTITYETWRNARSRCLNLNNPAYHNYGGRGIKFCKRWDSFENFLADMGERPSIKHQLDRINNDGNYEPGNCKWSTKKEQANNRRRSVLITYNGKTQSLKAWCDELGLIYSTICAKRRAGKWKVEDEFNK